MLRAKTFSKDNRSAIEIVNANQGCREVHFTNRRHVLPQHDAARFHGDGSERIDRGFKISQAKLADPNGIAQPRGSHFEAANEL